tara:strand:+ start:373 stop:1011 length:639 start_codon:yes stop_codon:yes gene_type:complete
MNYFYNILSIGLYEKVRNYIENNNGYNKKKIIARNWTGLFHATGAVCLSSAYIYLNSSYSNFNLDEKTINNFYYFIKTFSIGYFLNDTIFIFRFEKLTPLKFGFIYHHLATSYLLNIGPYIYADKLLFLGELSNIPIYFIYNYLKKDELTCREECKLQLWKYVQKILYCGLRIPIIGYYSYYALKKMNIYDQALLFPLYSMGFLWSCKILSK